MAAPYYDYVTPTTIELVSADPVVLQHFYGQNLDGAKQYLMAFNRDNLPTGGEIPEYSLGVEAGSISSFPVPGDARGALQGRRFNIGLVMAWSSTPDVYTAGVDSQMWIVAPAYTT